MEEQVYANIEEKSTTLDQDYQTMATIQGYSGMEGQIKAQPMSCTDHFGTPQRNPSIHGRCNKLAVCFLGLLCVLQLVAIIVLAVKNISVNDSINQMRNNLLNLTTQAQELENQYGDCPEQRALLERELGDLQARTEVLSGIINKSCPEGWQSLGSSIYFISTQKKSWSESKRDCRERGAELVIINSKEEQVFIRGLNMQLWIGLAEVSQGIWTWVDGTPLNERYWRTGEPNEYRRGEDCAESKPDSEMLNSWNDERCHTANHWVCERPACH